MLRTTSVSLIALLFFCTATAQNPGAGGCIGFNGTADYIAVPDHATLNDTTAITIEAWILPNGFSVNSYGNVIVGKDGWGSGPQGYTLRCGGSGSLSFNFGNGTGWTEVVTANVLQTQVWQHVAGTFDGTALRIYVNGMLVGTTSYTGTIDPGTYPLNIGRIPYTVQGSRFFQGELDEVRIWRTALPQSTLRDWMCRKVSASHPDYGQLGGYWRFDGGSGTILTDHSPNGNNGTLLGGPIWGLSGASIGDTSVYAYGGAVNLSIPGLNGGNFLLNNASGSPDGIQLYRVNEAPNLVNLPAGFVSFDTTCYYGAMVIGGTSANFDLTFSYGGNAYIGPNDGCIAAIAGRAANNFAVWYGIQADHQLAQSQLFRATIGPQQFILGRQPQPYPLLALGHVDFCPGDTAELATTSSGGLSYTWYQNGNLIPGATSASYTATQAGNYHVVVDDGTCAYPTDTLALSVFPVAAVSQNQLGMVCDNAGLQALVGSPPGGTFAGTGVVGSQFNPLIPAPGTYAITYTYTDTNMCTAVDTQLVTLNAATPASITNPADICDNEPPVTLTTGSPSSGTYGGPGVTGSTFDPAATGPGTFAISFLVVNANGCSDSDTAYINVLPAPTAPTVSIGGNTLYSSASSGNQWLLNGVPIPGATGNTHVPTASGVYSVVTTAANGCMSDTAMGFTFVGLDLAAQLQFESWPVPVEHVLQVSWMAAAGDDYALSLVDTRGRVLIRENGAASRNGSKELRLDLEDLPGGIYFLRLETPQGQGLRKIIRN